MKKLLTILGSLTIITGSSLSVVACGTKQEDDDTGSTFIDNNGDLKIDSEALMRWYQENMGMNNNVKQLKEFFQLFAVGIMKETEKGDNSLFNTIIPSDSNSQYAIENLQKTITESWGTPDSVNTSTVQGKVKSEFDKTVDEAKKSDGEKNWQKNMIDKLAKQFPYVKKDFDSLKKAWINNEILTNSSYGALTTLNKIFTNTYGQNINYMNSNSETLLNIFVNNWKEIQTNNLATVINDFVSNAENKSSSKYENIVDLINATGGAQEDIAHGTFTQPKIWKLDEIQWLSQQDTITSNLIDDLLYRLDTTYDNDKDLPNSVNITNFSGSTNVVNRISFVTKEGNELNTNNTFFDLVDPNYLPNANFDNLQLTGSTNYGLLTNSQRFLVDEYFKNQKPVAISEVVFKKTSDGNLEENITGQNFIKPTTISTDSWNQFYGLYDFLTNYVMESGAQTKGITDKIKGTSQYNFDTIFNKSDGQQILLKNTDQNDYYWNSKFFEAKNNENLLTLSDSTYSNIEKYSVYDFLQSTPSTNNLYSLSTTGIPGLTVNAISQDLITNWNFTDPNTANIIANSIMSAPSDQRNDILKALYTTLNLIKQLDRKVDTTSTSEYSTSESQKNNKVYQVLNSKQGIIAFIDTDGLHITKINGYDILKAPEETQKSNYLKNNEQNYINESLAFTKLNNYYKSDLQGSYRYIYQDYANNIGTQNGESDDFTNRLVSETEIERVGKYGVNYSDLNQAITNDYERFLVNNSILIANGTSGNNQTHPPFYKFDLLKQVRDSISNNANSDDKLNTNNSWIWDYMLNILDLDSNEELLKKFFNFNVNDETSLEMKNWYLEKLEINTKHTEMTGLNDFKNGWNQWYDNINKTKKSTPEENKDLPLMKLAYGTINTGENKITDKTHIDAIRKMKNFDPFKITTDQKYRFNVSSENYSFFQVKKGDK